MASSSSFPTFSSFHLLYFLSLFFFLSGAESNQEIIPNKDVSIQNPVSHLIPYPLLESSSTHEVKGVVSCGRVRVSGLPRSEIQSYANALQVTVTPSVVIPERYHNKIEVCFHGNSSLGLCQCAKDEWRVLKKGNWSTVMSPYEDRYLDVKLNNGVSGTIVISVDEEFHQWRLFCLGFGFVLLLLAPIFSKWALFYYSSSMIIGVLVVVLVILFQGMKLLPTGRKNIFYLTIYGSLVGVGSFLINSLSMLIDSVLLNFGLNEDMYNPVTVFLLVGVVLAGAALGHWIVRKFVMSEDGSVDVGVSHFVKWSMYIIGMTFIFQSTLDTPLALLALASCWGTCFTITSVLCRMPLSMHQSSANGSPWTRRTRHPSSNNKRAEFHSRSPKTPTPSRGPSQTTPKTLFSWSDSPTKGLVLPPNVVPNLNQDDYYSTFHKVSNRKKFSKKEWEDFTRESTRQALAKWASSPEFTDWIVENADRIRIEPDNTSDESGSESETSVENDF